eukprot:CAMPEP_0115851772 /NCGR_PEP_ID=MMETSP0287-20121206/12653_1 /TAXON_ID=412157 /ORGANISM="Chrysochromulina rotalis, Strain UIO044" /LENGTH=335 /DNA_ID=CAMNT_0003305813 /DNA_START=1 /DNA_END=1008 /DNA_ORIENTATION=-
MSPSSQALRVQGPVLPTRSDLSYLRCSATAGVDGTVPMQSLQPSPVLSPREVISSVMAGLHRSNWDAPTPYFGFEIALRFLAPTHQAKQNNAKPAGFYRYMRQPHKAFEIMWNEFRFEGELITLQTDDPSGLIQEECYQQCSMRSSPTDDWVSARWKLVKVDCDYGETVQRQWMVEAVFANEPDELEISSLVDVGRASDKEDDEVQALNWNGVYVPVESPKQVIGKVMRALRNMDTPYAFHGAAVATRYCSPKNRASELSPQVFARYLEDPWYSILVEWDEMDFDDEEDDEDEPLWNTAEIEVPVSRSEDGTSSMVYWKLSLYNGQWLIDSLNIV